MIMTTEHNHQSIVVSWFRRTYRDAIIFAIPNGGNRNPTEAKRLKAEGVLAGIPDICVVAKNKIFFVEMKGEKGRVSDSQKKIHDDMDRLGHTVYVCCGYAEAVEKIKGEMDEKERSETVSN